jgi:hypothetical protein
MDWMLNPALDVGYGTLRVPFVPVPVQRFSGDAELDDEIIAEILWLALAALFPPEADQRRLVRAHDDPSVRAADEQAAVHAGFVRAPCHYVLLPVATPSSPRDDS